jgi:hypothetical protein
VDGGSTFTLESALSKDSGYPLFALAMYSDLIGVAFDNSGENVQIHLLFVITSSSCSDLIWSYLNSLHVSDSPFKYLLFISFLLFSSFQYINFAFTPSFLFFLISAFSSHDLTSYACMWIRFQLALYV